MAVKRYNGSSWDIVAGVGPQGAAATSSSIATWVKTATGGETSVSGNDDNSQPLSYTVGQELVFINGALQKRGADYTATTGNSITGLTALAANDVVTVWTVNAFSVTNAISNTLVDAKGDLIVATGADTPGILTAGTTGQVLTVDSTTGTGLKWATPSAGGLTLLETMALSGASVTSSTIAGTYKNLLILVKAAQGSTHSEIGLRFNSDTGNNYGRFQTRNQDNTISGDTGTGLNKVIFASISSSSTITDRTYAAINVYRYADTDITYFDLTAYARYSTQLNQYITSGYYDQSAAISTVTINIESGTFSAGNVYIYGVN